MNIKKGICMLLAALFLSATVSTSSYAATQKYGTYGGRTYYAKTRTDQRTIIKTSSTYKQKIWNQFKEDSLNFVFTVIESSGEELVKPVTITFKTLLKLAGLSDASGVTIKKGSFFQYVIKLDVTERKIKASGDNYYVYQDEKGKADVFYQFYPVGTGWKRACLEKKLYSNKSVMTPYYHDSKNAVLKVCNTYRNHHGRVVWNLDQQMIKLTTTNK